MVNLYKELEVGSIFFQEINCDGPLMSQHKVNMTFFNDCCSRAFYFTAESVCFHSMGYPFDLCSSWQVDVWLIHKHFWLKYFFSLYTSHPSIDFTWFELFNNERFYGRPLNKSVAYICTATKLKCKTLNNFCNKLTLNIAYLKFMRKQSKKIVYST